MKIIIFYAKYGGGHLSAANSIKQYLENNYKNIDKNISIEIIDCMDYVNSTVNNLTTSAYKQMAQKYPWAWGKLYDESQNGYIAHISTRANKILAIKLLKLLRSKNPDLIISTHPFGSQMTSYLKRKGKIDVRLATIMTDFAPHDQWLVGSNETNYYFVANDKIKDYITKTKKIKNPKVYTSGIPISPAFNISYSKSEYLKSLGLDSDKFTILFFGGGEYGLGKSKTLEIFENLNELDENIQIIAISGKNEFLHEKFSEIAKNKSNIKILTYSNEVPQLMQSCNLILTKPGGLTTSEALSSNIPMVIINPIPGQEVENAHYLVKNHVAKWIRNPKYTKNIINDLINDPNSLNTMKENMKKLAHPNSTKNICDILISDNLDSNTEKIITTPTV